MTPYYADDAVTLYLGDCREVTEWLAADVLVTDPPYGRDWKQGETRSRSVHGLTGKRPTSDRRAGIAGDRDTGTRDAVLAAWGDRRPALVFGDPMLAPPPDTRQVAFYRKPPNAGTKGTFGGFRRDVEAVYLIGPWPAGLGGRSSVIGTSTPSQGNPSSPQGRYGHPHAKPVDVMEQLIVVCPPGVIADPCAGSGSTLVAARNLGRPAIGVELMERDCETIARRLSQGVLPIGVTP
jgi:hypothetical protein